MIDDHSVQIISDLYPLHHKINSLFAEYYQPNISTERRCELADEIHSLERVCEAYQSFALHKLHCSSLNIVD